MIRFMYMFTETDRLSVIAVSVFVPSMVYCKRISAIDFWCDGLVEVYQLSRAVMLPVYELLRTNQRSLLFPASLTLTASHFRPVT